MEGIWGVQAECFFANNDYNKDMHSVGLAKEI